MANDTAVPLNRIERILAFMIGSVAGVAILSMIGVMVANLAGVDVTAGLWPVLATIPFVGFSLALVLIVGFTIARIVRTRRAAGDGS